MIKVELVILLQARIGKIGLRSYLHRIEVTESAKCECGGTENVQYILLQCLKWAGYRKKYLEQKRDLRKLLGDLICIKNTIKFLHETELLNQFRHV